MSDSADYCDKCKRHMRVIDALFDIAIIYNLRYQDGEYWVFDHTGEGLVGAPTKQELLDKLATWDGGMEEQ